MRFISGLPIELVQGPSDLKANATGSRIVVICKYLLIKTRI